jgi:hypothetical protein
VQVEQLELEFGSRQNLALDAAERTDEEWIDSRLQPSHCAGDSQAGIEMSAGAPTGE